MAVSIKGKLCHGLTDTGADVSVIALHERPEQWEKMASRMAVTGVGGTHLPMQSEESLKCIGPEGQVEHIQPFIPPIPVSLWAETSYNNGKSQFSLLGRGHC